MARFRRYIGIDYSGAKTPTSSLPGLAVYLAAEEGRPTEVLPPAGRHKYWSRQGIAEWLVDCLSDEVPTLVGIDHGFSFPRAYFEAHGVKTDWPAFLDDFCLHWPTDEPGTWVRDVRAGKVGNAAARSGDARWRRLTERRAGAAKSVFRFDVQGNVANSTHAGIPWLRYLRRRCDVPIHFWPFDGWEPVHGRTVVAEVYPALWKRSVPTQGRNEHQQDAYAVAAWMQRADHFGDLDTFLSPPLTAEERTKAEVEGWILGVE